MLIKVLLRLRTSRSWTDIINTWIKIKTVPTYVVHSIKYEINKEIILRQCVQQPKLHNKTYIQASTSTYKCKCVEKNNIKVSQPIIHTCIEKCTRNKINKSFILLPLELPLNHLSSVTGKKGVCRGEGALN